MEDFVPFLSAPWSCGSRGELGGGVLERSRTMAAIHSLGRGFRGRRRDRVRSFFVFFWDFNRRIIKSPALASTLG